MKYFIKFVSIIGLLAVAHFAYAGSINHTFATGDTLEASHLNDATTAINDNDARISVLEVVYVIGDTGPAGGWVFYVDVNGQHGLEAALTDQSISIKWDNGASTFTEALGDGVGAGEMNTMLIIANQGFDSNNYAAGICANLVITNAGVDYGDWYLPSKYELNLMYLNIGPGSTLGNVAGFVNTTYWSSSEIDDFNASIQNLGGGGQGSGTKSLNANVRAIRAF